MTQVGHTYRAHVGRAGLSSKQDPDPVLQTSEGVKALLE